MRSLVGLLLAIVLAGCGPTPLSLDDYADSVESLGRTYEDISTGLQRTLHDDLQFEIDDILKEVDQNDPAAVEALAEEALVLTVARTTAFFAGLGDGLHVYRSALGELVPPRSVEAEHDEFIDAMDGVLAGLPGLLAALADIDDFDGLDVAVNGSVFTDAGPRLVAACGRLEQRLIDRGTAVNLRCPA